MKREWLFLVYTVVIHALALLGLLDLMVRVETDISQSVESSGALTGSGNRCRPTPY
jgi:hypothetical protein